MKLKILYLILFILMFIPIGLCEKIQDIEEINNTKIYNKNDKIISIYDENNNKSMDIKLISTLSDIDKFIKIVEITNYIEYISKENDFITNIKKIYGKNNIYKIKYFIEKYNYTFDYIIINETIFNNKTNKNEIKLINKTIIKDIKSYWIEFKPYNKTIFKNEKFKLKIIHYKKPELGFFKIQTIPIFKNIECKEFTWWLGNWNLKRPILINNTYGDNVTDYQLKSVNLSEYQINASSTRIINESSGLQENFWNESVNSNGNLEFVWCNFSKILNNTWVNNIYYIYYQSNPNVSSVSNGNLTFIQYHDLATSYYLDSLDVIISPLIYETKIKVLADGHNIQFGLFNTNPDINYDAFYFQPYDGGSNNHRYYGCHNDTLNSQLGEIPKLTANIFYRGKLVFDGITLKGYFNDNEINFGGISTNIPNTNLGLLLKEHTENAEQKWCFIRKYTSNEPKLWTVGNIEYPGVLDMNCSLKIITHLTNKKVQIVDMNASIVDESYTNECINLSYDSYIVYMSNPVKISSFTELLNILDNFLIQALLFIFLIIIATLFYVFIQIVKKKGFKL